MPTIQRNKKLAPWEDEDILNQRSILISAKRRSRICKSDLNKEIAKKEAKILADLYIQKRDYYLNEKCDEINQMNAEKKYKNAWKLINILSGRKNKYQGLVPAESPSDRLSIWKTHLKKS